MALFRVSYKTAKTRLPNYPYHYIVLERKSPFSFGHYVSTTVEDRVIGRTL